MGEGERRNGEGGREVRVEEWEEWGGEGGDGGRMGGMGGRGGRGGDGGGMGGMGRRDGGSLLFSPVCGQYGLILGPIGGPGLVPHGNDPLPHPLLVSLL